MRGCAMWRISGSAMRCGAMRRGATTTRRRGNCHSATLGSRKSSIARRQRRVDVGARRRSASCIRRDVRRRRQPCAGVRVESLSLPRHDSLRCRPSGSAHLGAAPSGLSGARRRARVLEWHIQATSITSRLNDGRMGSARAIGHSRDLLVRYMRYQGRAHLKSAACAMIRRGLMARRSWIHKCVSMA